MYSWNLRGSLLWKKVTIEKKNKVAISYNNEFLIINPTLLQEINYVSITETDNLSPTRDVNFSKTHDCIETEINYVLPMDHVFVWQINDNDIIEVNEGLKYTCAFAVRKNYLNL